jgi:hypothetical protein
VGQALLISFAALAGGFVAAAVREALASAPGVAGWLREAVLPLGRARATPRAPKSSGAWG